MRAGRFAAAVLALGLSVAAAAEAQFGVDPPARRQGPGEGKLQFSGFIGSQSLDQSLGTATNIYQSVSGEAENISFGKLYGFRASWAFTRNLTAEFNLSAGSNAYTFTVDDDFAGSLDLGEQLEADHLNFGGNVVFEIPAGNFVPYATAGVGSLRTTPSTDIAGVDNVSALDFNVGGGVKIWLSAPHWLGFRADVRYHTADDGLTFADAGSSSGSTKGLEFTVGVALRFF